MRQLLIVSIHMDELADLTAFRLNAEKVLGKLYGNAEAYRL